MRFSLLLLSVVTVLVACILPTVDAQYGCSNYYSSSSCNSLYNCYWCSSGAYCTSTSNYCSSTASCSSIYSSSTCNAASNCWWCNGGCVDLSSSCSTVTGLTGAGLAFVIIGPMLFFICLAVVIFYAICRRRQTGVVMTATGAPLTYNAYGQPQGPYQPMAGAAYSNNSDFPAGQSGGYGYAQQPGGVYGQPYAPYASSPQPSYPPPQQDCSQPQPTYPQGQYNYPAPQ